MAKIIHFFPKKEEIIYDQLIMKSDFITHPTKNRVLYALCNPFCVAACIVLVVVSSAVQYAVPWEETLFMSTLLLMAFLHRYQFFSKHTKGHGVLKKKNMGFSKNAIVVEMCIVTFSLILVPVSFLQDIYALRVLMIGMCLLLIGSLATLRFYLYYQNWYVDEYVIREYLKNTCKYPDSRIHQTIHLLRNQGKIA